MLWVCRVYHFPGELRQPLPDPLARYAVPAILASSAGLRFPVQPTSGAELDPIGGLGQGGQQGPALLVAGPRYAGRANTVRTSIFASLRVSCLAQPAGSGANVTTSRPSGSASLRGPAPTVSSGIGSPCSARSITTSMGGVWPVSSNWSKT